MKAVSENEKTSTEILNKQRPLGLRDFGLFVIEEDTPQQLSQTLDELHDHIKNHAGSGGNLELAAFKWYQQKGLHPHKKLALALTIKPSDDLERLINLARQKIQDPEKGLPDNHPSISYAPRPMRHGGYPGCCISRLRQPLSGDGT